MKELSEQGKGTPNSEDQLLADALKKIGEWLNASPEDQDKQNADLLQTLSKLTGKQLDANVLQMLQVLCKQLNQKCQAGRINCSQKRRKSFQKLKRL